MNGLMKLVVSQVTQIRVETELLIVGPEPLGVQPVRPAPVKECRAVPDYRVPGSVSCGATTIHPSRSPGTRTYCCPSAGTMVTSVLWAVSVSRTASNPSIEVF